MRLIEQRTVKASLEEAFDFTADFSNSQEWDPGVATSSKVGDEPLAVGTKFDLEVTFGGSTIPMTYEITSLEPHERVVLKGSGATLDAVDDIRFRSSENGTVIDYTADLTFHNFVRYVAPLMKPLISRMVGRKALDGLAKALDG